MKFIQKNAETPLELELTGSEEWVIGRDPEQCDIVLEDEATSRRQLLCRRVEEGLEVDNLSDTTPLLINDQEVDQPTLIVDGDVVQIGSQLFQFADTTEEPDSHADWSDELHDDEESADIENEEPNPEVEVEIDDKELPQEDNGDLETEEELPQLEHDTLFDAEIDEQLFSEINLSMAEEGRWVVKVLSGPNNGAEFFMEPGRSYTLGSDAAHADILFHDLSVSKQHAKITIDDNSKVIIEDLGSRNGIQLDDKKVEGEQVIESGALITIGTTTFVVVDREAEQKTIVPPPLATLSKVIKDDATLEAAETALKTVAKEKSAEESAKTAAKQAEKNSKVAFLAILGAALLTGLMIISFLFRIEEVQKAEVDQQSAISEALADFPSVRYSYSDKTGQLLLIGHVQTITDRSQLFYNLDGLDFIRNIDDNIIIDEFAWQEINQILAKRPDWRAITVTAPRPGVFVMTGYLQTRQQSDELSEYITLHFPYPELLENRVVIEENVLSRIDVLLSEAGLVTISPEMNNGEVTLTGRMSYGNAGKLKSIMDEIRSLTGVRNVKNFVAEQKPEVLMVDISGEYDVTGHSNNRGNISVIINGRILTPGDTLDGMRIIRIVPGTIMLERDGFKYKIDFN